MIKEAGRDAEVHGVCTQGINLFRVLITLLAPAIPFTAAARRRISELPGKSVVGTGPAAARVALNAVSAAALPA